MPSATYDYLYRFLETLPAISTHSHHLPDDVHTGLTLDRILESSYLVALACRGDDDPPRSGDFLGLKPRSIMFPGSHAARRDGFLAQIRYNTYFVWLQKAIQEIYRCASPISAENWDELSARIQARHVDSRAHLAILRDVAGYRRIVQDSYWDYASDLGHPEIFSTEMRTDMFIHCYHPEVSDHDGNNPFQHYPQAPTTNLDDYLAFLEDLFTGWRNSGAVTMKSAAAYDRTLQYEAPDHDRAAKVFLQAPDRVSPSEHKAYGDFIFHWLCQLCLRLDVPFQIHTGLAKLSGSRPVLLEPIISQYPQIRFVLLHAGYPWYSDSAGLAHNFGNVYLDLTWVPITSTYGAVQALSEFIDVAHSSNRIAWGDDAFTSEETFGALLAWRHVVAKVLSDKVDDGYFQIKQAEALAARLMHQNAIELYGLPVELSPDSYSQ